MDVLRILPALVLVEDVEQFAEEIPAVVLGDLLRDRNQLDARLAQLADIELRMHRVATEAAQRMDDNEVEGMIRPLGGIDHLLEDGTILVEGGGTGFGEHLDDLEALLCAPCSALGDLIGEREVMLGLAGGGHSRIDRRPGHKKLLLAEEYLVDLPSKVRAQNSDFVGQWRKRAGKVGDDGNVAFGSGVLALDLVSLTAR